MGILLECRSCGAEGMYDRHSDNESKGTVIVGEEGFTYTCEKCKKIESSY